MQNIVRPSRSNESVKAPTSFPEYLKNAERLVVKLCGDTTAPSLHDLILQVKQYYKLLPWERVYRDASTNYELTANNM
jgi:hypothetical protein